MAQPTQERLAAQLEKPEQTSGNVGHAGSGTGPENAPHFEGHEDDHVHHVAMPTYYAVFALLMVLLFVTVGAWYIDQHYYPLGKLSTPIAMAIAVAKAVAIVLIFMHVKFASRLVQIFACTGVAFASIMFLLTFNDYGTRTWLPVAGVYIQTADNEVQNTGLLVRSAAVGASPNDQSTPSDSMGAPSSVAPSSTSATTTTSPSIAPMATGNGVNGADISISPNADETRPGATLGGAANNSFGSAAQSRGIEPKPATRIPAARLRPAAPTATR